MVMVSISVSHQNGAEQREIWRKQGLGRSPHPVTHEAPPAIAGCCRRLSLRVNGGGTFRECGLPIFPSLAAWVGIGDQPLL